MSSGRHGLTSGPGHKARGGRTQHIDSEQDDREAGRSHMELETAPRCFFFFALRSALICRPSPSLLEI